MLPWGPSNGLGLYMCFSLSPPGIVFDFAALTISGQSSIFSQVIAGTAVAMLLSCGHFLDRPGVTDCNQI